MARVVSHLMRSLVSSQNSEHEISEANVSLISGKNIKSEIKEYKTSTWITIKILAELHDE